MRGTRWLVLVAIAAIIFGVGVTYQQQKTNNRKNAVAAPPALPDNVSSNTIGGDWVTKDQKTGCTNYELLSKDMRAASDSSHSELSGVELHIFHKSAKACDTKFDLVRSAAATYFDSEGRLYAEGDVNITLGEPVKARRRRIWFPSHRPASPSTRKRATPIRPAHHVRFQEWRGPFERRHLRPATKELLMKTQCGGGLAPRRAPRQAAAHRGAQPADTARPRPRSTWRLPAR